MALYTDEFLLFISCTELLPLEVTTIIACYCNLYHSVAIHSIQDTVNFIFIQWCNDVHCLVLFTLVTLIILFIFDCYWNLRCSFHRVIYHTAKTYSCLATARWEPIILQANSVVFFLTVSHDNYLKWVSSAIFEKSLNLRQYCNKLLSSVQLTAVLHWETFWLHCSLFLPDQ